MLQILVGHPHQKVVFVSAENYDGMTKNEAFYMKLQKVGVELDIREYKYKTYCCANCKQVNKQKVQAEVDVAIAVKLLDYAAMPHVQTLTLFAGDRDFLDAIKYAQEVLLKPVQIMAFESNVSDRLSSLALAEVILLNNHWEALAAGSKNFPVSTTSKSRTRDTGM